MCCQFWPCCWPLPTKAGEGEADGEEEIDEDAQELLETLKDMMGKGDSKPRNTEWLYLEKYDHNTGENEPMGKLCVGLWIGPKVDGTSTKMFCSTSIMYSEFCIFSYYTADKLPAGFGRNEPNANPKLPKPTGRLKFSLNPFVMGADLCGPKICAQITCCLVCIGIICIMLFCGPVFNFVTAFLLAQIG